MIKKILVLACMALISNSGSVFAQTQEAIPEKKLISLVLQNKPLKQVADDIQKQTGYTIVFDEKWNTLPLSGQYAEVTLDDFFWRALRKQNVSLTYDDKSNVAYLRFFGDSALTKVNSVATESDDGVDVKIKEEIRVLHEQQSQELAAYLKDPEAVDPLSGMKLVDIRTMHEQQQEELATYLKSPDAVEPDSGMKLADVKKMQDTQAAEWEKERNDPNAVEPESGMTRAEINKLHETQHAELEQLKKQYQHGAVPDEVHGGEKG